jgi:hypothetical protein
MVRAWESRSLSKTSVVLNATNVTAFIETDRLDVVRETDALAAGENAS